MSNIIYKLVLAALNEEDTGMLQYELGERINNHDVAKAIVDAIKKAVSDFDTGNMSLEDY